MRYDSTSVASSRRSSAYRAVEEAAAARTAMLTGEAEEQRVLARLAYIRAKYNEQNKVITAKLCDRKPEGLQPATNGAIRKVDAMGYRLEEMRDQILQRQLRMEVQMAELNTNCIR